MSIPMLRATLVLMALALLVGPPAVSSAALTLAQRAASVAAACIVGLAAVLVRVPDVPAMVETAEPVVLDVQSDTAAAPDEPHAVLVGRSADGDRIVLDATAGIAVIGHGAVAVAVFVAIAVALARCATTDTNTTAVTNTTADTDTDADPDAAELRTAMADDLEPDGDTGVLPGTVRRSGTGLAAGTAVSVLLDDHGVRRASVVLVPDLRTVPRQAGPAIDVTRYGCSARISPCDAAGVRLVPTLPVLAVPLPAPTTVSTARRAR